MSQSSIILNDCRGPGTSAVWLGAFPEPKVMAKDAHLVGVVTDQKDGWVPFPIPKEVQLSADMHLTRPQVEALVHHLQCWLANGTFRHANEAPEEADGTPETAHE